MLGFKDFRFARILLSGIEIMHMIAKGQIEDAVKLKSSSARQFYFGKEPLILLNDAFATRRFIDDHCARRHIRPFVVIEANSTSAIVEMVHRGQLATILPDHIARLHEGLHPMPLDPPLPTRTAAVLQRKGAYRTAASRAFVQLLTERFGKSK